jgi:chemotaxis protein MotB
MAAHDRPEGHPEGKKQRRHGGAPHGAPHVEKDESEVRWLISYSDFMMQLVCLFILLYSVSSIDTGKAGAMAAGWRDEIGMDPVTVTLSKGPSTPLTLAEIPGTLRQIAGVLSRYPEGGQIRISPTDTGFRFQLAYEMFDEGSPRLSRPGQRFADLAALILHPYQTRVRAIEVVGHSAADPGDREDGSALGLSLSRAREAILWISRAELPHRIEPLVLYPAGRGPHDPIADSATPGSRGLNRRVDFFVHVDSKKRQDR